MTMRLRSSSCASPQRPLSSWSLPTDAFVKKQHKTSFSYAVILITCLWRYYRPGFINIRITWKPFETRNCWAPPPVFLIWWVWDLRICPSNKMPLVPGPLWKPLLQFMKHVSENWIILSGRYGKFKPCFFFPVARLPHLPWLQRLSAAQSVCMGFQQEEKKAWKPGLFLKGLET